MIGWFSSKTDGTPSLKGLPLHGSRLRISFDALSLGVDNVHHDVHLSPTFQEAADRTIFLLLVRHTRSESILKVDRRANLFREMELFKRLCRNVHMEGINQAREARNPQIDHLTQMSVLKYVTCRMESRYTRLVDRYKRSIRECQVSGRKEETLPLKDRLAVLIDDRQDILRRAGAEMFAAITEVNEQLTPIRELNFGREALLPADLLSNPMLHVDNPFADFFMIEEYGILLGRRAEDPDRYTTLIFRIKDLFLDIDRRDRSEKEDRPRSADPPLDDEIIESWMKSVENVDILFNYFQSRYQYRQERRGRENDRHLRMLKQRAAEQKRRLDFLYRNLNARPSDGAPEEQPSATSSPPPVFKERREIDAGPPHPSRILGKDRRTGLIERVIAAFEMQPIYRRYCPPLSPQLLLQYIVSPGIRKHVETRLKRLKQFYGRSFSLLPLKQVTRHAGRIRRRAEKGYFLRFLTGLFRFHRDFQNGTIVREAMGALRLLTDERTTHLSRTNYSLYEFLLPDEQVNGRRPIINHVVLKADIRGSTDITHRMVEKRLNPATFFSINLFDPITEILPEYGARKVFVEGDAIILSIFERDGTPDGWYAVARACGLAVTILSIVQRYNKRSRAQGLPIIELGIGIGFNQGPPTFLMDGENRIMISSAINLADRLSGCSRYLRGEMDGIASPFRLFVYQSSGDADLAATYDDLLLRYNVNGIELSTDGFSKLSREIDLRPVEIPAGNWGKEKTAFYAGKVPTLSGRYQPLIICEARVPRIQSETLTTAQLTPRKYYEVCADQRIYDHIRVKDPAPADTGSRMGLSG